MLLRAGEEVICLSSVLQCCVDLRSSIEGSIVVVAVTRSIAFEWFSIMSTSFFYLDTFVVVCVPFFQIISRA